MPVNVLKRNAAISASWKWPVICVLALVWAITAGLAWTLNRLGVGLNVGAEWALDRIIELRAA